MANPERAGILKVRRALSLALGSGILVGGTELDTTQSSYYIQYQVNGNLLTALVNTETISGITSIEHGRPCGVLIIHTNSDEMNRYDYYPEEIESFKLF